MLLLTLSKAMFAALVTSKLPSMPRLCHCPQWERAVLQKTAKSSPLPQRRAVGMVGMKSVSCPNSHCSAPPHSSVLGTRQPCECVNQGCIK